MAQESLYAEAGQGLDREPPHIETTAKIHPKEEGVLFQLSVEIVGVGERVIVVGFPDEPHSDRTTHHGSDAEPSIYTQAEIADVFMKGSADSSHPSMGKWKSWSMGISADQIEKAEKRIATKAELMIDNYVIRARKEWVSILLKKKSQDILRPLRAKINATWKAQREHFRLAKEKMPDFESIFGSGSIKSISAASIAKDRFLADRKKHLAEARALRQTHRELSSKLDWIKRDIVSKGFSKELADEISNTVTFMRYAEDQGLSNLRKQYGERLAALTMPFQIGSSITKVLEGVADEIKDSYNDLLAGMKAPPLATKTIYNRRWRGYDGSVPLYESGEFASTLYAEVI